MIAVIIRGSQDHLFLIGQPDHAKLSAAVMAAWQRDPMADERRELILLATGEHDNGWREEDAAPLVDPPSGRVLDFVTAPDAVRQRVWPRGIGRLASTPYAAALVAHHALSVYERSRPDPAWQPFFDRIEALRDDMLKQAAPFSIDSLEPDYFFVRMGDLISLIFCNGWQEPQKLGDYELRLDGPRLSIRPDPFNRREVLLSVEARQLPNRPLAAAEALAAFQSAPVVTVTGVALGAP
jgi:hypothetical protein